jgi:hypothetical protein
LGLPKYRRRWGSAGQNQHLPHFLFCAILEEIVMIEMDDVKIVLLKSNHHLISKINELRTDDEKPVCFLLEVPLLVSYGPADAPDEELKISLSRWMPFSKSPSFRIPFDQVVTIGDPKDAILEKYIELVKPYYPIDNNPDPNKSSEGEKSND